MFLGTVKLAGNLTFYTTTRTLATDAAVDADAAPGYRVYEDETGTPLLTGSMALLDDANTTGFYSEQIAVTTANGFEVGKNYCIRITKVIGGVTSSEPQTFAVDSKRISDLNDLAAGAAMTISGTLGTFDALWAKIQKWLRLALRKDAATATDCATELTEINASGGSGAGTYANTADSQEALRDNYDVSAAAVAAALAGSTISIQRGDVFTANFTGLGSIATRTKCRFVIKNSKDDLDAASYIYIDEAAGLTIVNGAAYATTTDGSILVTNAVTGALTITINAAVTKNFTKQSRFYGIEVIEAAGPRTVTEGSCVVTYDAVRAVA